MDYAKLHNVKLHNLFQTRKFHYHYYLLFMIFLHSLLVLTSYISHLQRIKEPSRDYAITLATHTITTNVQKTRNKPFIDTYN